MKAPQSVFLLVFVLCFSRLAFVQTNPNLETGFTPYGSYDDTRFDSVSLTNHNLIVHIPIFEYPQRGRLDLQIELLYNNKGWYVVPDCSSNGTCTPVWGFQGTGVQEQPHLDSISGTWRVVQTAPNVYLTIFSAKDSDGSIHQLAGTNRGGFESIDASGIYFNDPGGTSSPFVIKNRNGDGLTGTSGNNWQDTNGNYINLFAPYNDTLNRTFYSTADDGSGTSGCRTGTGLLPVTSAGIAGYPGPNGSTRRVKGCSATLNLQSNFGAHTFINDTRWPISEHSGTETVLQSVIVYNGVSWSTSPQWVFQYADNADGSNYGDLTQITLPTGGTVTYTWGTFAPCGSMHQLTPVSRGITSRTVNANDGKGAQTTTYSGGTVTDPAGNDTVHVITGLNGSCALYETETDYWTGSSASGGTGTLLKKVLTAYSSTTNPFDNYGDGTITQANVVPTSVTTKWPIPNTTNFLVSQVQTDYDQGFIFGLGTNINGRYGLMTQKREYGYGLNSPGALLRKTVYTYKALTNTSYLNPANVLTPVAQITTYDGISGSMVSQITNTYDGTTLQPSGVTTRHNSVANPGFRGNLTKVQKWLNTTGGLVTTAQTQYYDTGTPYIATDLKNNQTQYTYDAAYVGAYLTKTQYPNTGAAVTHSVQGAYDFNTGLLTSFTDQNLQVSNYGYDVLGRVTSGSYPDGGSIGLQYTDTVPVQISKTVAITSSLDKVTNSVFDGLGRVSQTQLTDPDCTTGSGLVKADYTYGNDTTQNTHYTTVTTPYCNTPGATFGLPIRTDSDALGRTIKITQADGSIASTSFIPNSTTLNECATATDEAGKSRTSCADALGRMNGVWEDPGTSPHLNYETDYGYNLLDDLTSVNQKGDNSAPRTRSFVYDSLSRLTSATNPESGAISYTYSNSSTGCSPNPGTVCTKVAPAPNVTSGSGTVTTTYSYDAFDRLTQKTYSDGTTPSVSFGYDADTSTLGCATVPSLTDTYPKAQRTGMCDGSGATAWAHDQIGRVLTEKRMINGTSAWIKSAGYVYNLDGSIKTISNPGVGRVMAYTMNAAGRPGSVVNAGGNINFVTGATYAPFGGLLTAVNGSASGFSGITNTNSYNRRLQPLALSSASPSQTLLSLTYDFHSGSGDNGNVYKITNNRDNNRTQNFLYDALNRIQQAYSSGPNWGETFGPTATNPGTPPSNPGIDPWGNLINRSGVIGKTLTEGLSAVANTKNQLAGFGYDIAGNMVSNGSASYTYDAENRVIGAAGWTYVYDGDGRRVKKFSGSTGTLYWPDLSGNTLNESSLGATNLHEYVYFSGKRVARIDVPTPLTVKYYFSDYLGSASVITDATGNTLEDSDYFPYGGEIAITNNDGNNYKFTGKERDAETCTSACLDYFGARHYTSALGRFMTPDWSASAEALPYGDLSDPQSLNLYSYTRNNPLSRTDPNGHCDVDGEHHTFFWCVGHALGFEETKKETQQRIDNERQALLNARNSDGSPLSGAQRARLSRASATQIDELYQQVKSDTDALQNENDSRRALGLPPIPIPGGESTGRTQAKNLKEQLAMEQAQSDPAAGQQIQNIQMRDSRWPSDQGWVKMRQNVNGVEIHYVRNVNTGAVADFKFVSP